MYVYKIRSLNFPEALDIGVYFTNITAVTAFLTKSHKRSEDEELIKSVLDLGLMIAQKFGCTEEDAAKRKKYSNLYVSFLTNKAHTWLGIDCDQSTPILYWTYHDITFMLSTQKLRWLDPYSLCMFGILGPEQRIFPSQEALNDYINKKYAIAEAKKQADCDRHKKYIYISKPKKNEFEGGE